MEKSAVDTARSVLKLLAVMKKPANPVLGRLAQAVVDAADQRIEDYRSGYSAGWSHGKNGEPMHDLESAKRFFNISDGAPQEQEP